MASLYRTALAFQQNIISKNKTIVTWWVYATVASPRASTYATHKTVVIKHESILYLCGCVVHSGRRIWATWTAHCVWMNSSVRVEAPWTPELCPCVCVYVRARASGRDTRVVLLSGGMDGTLGAGGARSGRDEEVFLATWLDTTRWRVRGVGPTTGEGHEGEPTGCQDEHAPPFRCLTTRHVWRIRRNWYIRDELTRTQRGAATQSAINVIEDEKGSTFKGINTALLLKKINCAECLIGFVPFCFALVNLYFKYK